MRSWLTVILFSICTISFTQDLDSLWNEVRTNPNDSIVDEAFNKIFKNLLKSQSDSSLKACETFLSISKERNSKYLEGCYHMSLAYILQTLRKSEESLDHALKSEKIFLDLNKHRKLAGSYMLIGNNLNRKGQIPEAISYFNKVINIYRKENLTKEIIGVYINMANSYYQLEDYDMSTYYYQKSININIENDTFNLKAFEIANFNLGCVYSAKLGKHDSALYALKQAMIIREKEQNKLQLVDNYSIICEVFIEKKDLDSAQYYSNKAMSLAEEINFTDNNNLLQSRIALFNQISPEKSFPILEKLFIKYQNSNELDVLKSLHKYSYEAYIKIGDKANAFDHFKSYVELRDSIANEENYRKTIQQKSEDELAQKEFEQQQVLLKKEIENLAHRKRMSLIAAFGTFIAAISLFAFYTIKKRYTIISRQKKIIQIQKDQVNKQFGLIEEKNIQITDSIEYAKRIQRSLLKSFSELNSPISNSFIFYQPKDIVSGDFYWSHQEGNITWLALADCTGHGVPGALMSILGLQLLDKLVTQAINSDPNLILDQLDTAIRAKLGDDSNESMDGMDLILLRIDANSKTITFSGAHNAVHLIQNGEIKSFKGDSLYIGKSININSPLQSFRSQFIPFNSGDKLYFFTDGFSDQKGGPKYKKYYSKRLKNLLLKLSDQTFIDQQKEIQSEFNNWKKGNEQMDDVTVIGVELE